jgi:hypothetical protein
LALTGVLSLGGEVLVLDYWIFILGIIPPWHGDVCTRTTVCTFVTIVNYRHMFDCFASPKWLHFIFQQLAKLSQNLDAYYAY